MLVFFKRYDAHLCSEVAEQVLLNGKPIVGIKVKRGLNYIDDKKRYDNSYTDSEGRFKLPAVNVRLKAPGWLFAEQFTMQLVYVEYNNRPYILWNACLSGIEPIIGYGNKLNILQADLSNAEIAFTIINKDSPNAPHCVSSICHWDENFEILHIIED